MYHRISNVKSLGGLEIEATFRDGSVKRYDAAPLLELHPAFRALRDIPGLANLVHVDVGGYGVAWNDDIDLDAEDIWMNGVPATP